MNIEFFKKYFNEVENWENDEVKVLCPLHGDNRPSASINTKEGLFYCFTCAKGYNEEQFMATINGISVPDAIKLLDKYNIIEDWNTPRGRLWSDTKMLDALHNLGLSDSTIEELKLGEVKDSSLRPLLGIPVFYNNMLVDIRRYNIYKYDNQPKMVGTEGATTGWVVPYDNFVSSKDTCYFLEGEKDMMVARENGLNAYTLTGGAGAKPNKYVLNSFKDKDIVICYDNDDAGRKGMNTLFTEIKDISKSIRYINIGDVVNENKEDFTDYMTKYNGDLFTFLSLEQHTFNLEETEKTKTITIKDALKDNRLKKELKSIVTVTSEFADTYSVPTIVELKKVGEGNSRTDMLMLGEERSWFLEEENLQEFLELIEINAKNVDITQKLKSFMGVSPKETLVEIKTKENRTIYKSVISDKENDGSNINLDIYSFVKLEVGMQYLIKYKIYPHPTKNQKLVAIAIDVKSMSDTTTYNIDKAKIGKFKMDGTIEERVNKLYQSAKHHIAKHLNYDIWLMSDLVFNSVLDFTYGDEVERGALDVFFLGDTRTGKALPLYEKVLTDKGYKRMGDITKNDKVFCETGEMVDINYISYQGVRPTYRITFSDDTYVDCDEQHLWKVQSSKQRNCTGNYKVMSTKELLTVDYSRYSIDRVKPINFPYKDVRIDPYTLGVLLGDGSLINMAKLTNSEEDIVDKIRTIYDITEYKGNEYNIKNIIKDLKYYNLIGCNARHKFIPDDYLYNSKQIRLDILRGLLDTDGYVDKNAVEYSTTSKNLADGVKFLVESLGGRCTTKIKTNKFGEYYRLWISFYNDIIPVSSIKHLNKYKKPIKNLKRIIKNIEYLGQTECQCINVNHDSHTFITNNCTITHNSEATSKLTNLYNFGHFLSLKTSTTVGLIGGSNKVDGSLCNTIGAIPRQHKKLVVLEEFSGADPSFIKTMTDIRSSNELRITRVNGELRVPCKLRMITISNPINDNDGNPRFLSMFPNGVKPIMELIRSAEDVARYDGFLLIPKVEEKINPFLIKLEGEPIPKECYEEKAKYTITRTKENIIFDEGVESYIWERSEELNKKYECNFPVFDVTTHKKVARYCVALANLVMSVSDDYENIIVTKDIVDFIIKFLDTIYSSQAFRLDKYADEYKEYGVCSELDIKHLQDIYANNSTLIEFLSSQDSSTRTNLLSISGLDSNKFSSVFNRLVAYKFIKLNKENVFPTKKFRLSYQSINKEVRTDTGNRIENSNGVEFINDL